MQADFAEEGLIDLSHAAKGGDPEKTEGWKCQKRAFERAKSRIKGSGIIKLERTKTRKRRIWKNKSNIQCTQWSNNTITCKLCRQQQHIRLLHKRNKKYGI